MPGATENSAEVQRVGDAAGEHRMIRRGKYAAWFHVGLAFLLEAAIFGGLEETVAVRLHWPNTDVGFIGSGVLGALLVFWNRWRCIEAFSSRYCSGAANFSLFYVPLVAFGYANYRGFMKLRGR
jgi:hypothetical protein